MFDKMLTSGAGGIALFALVLLAPCVQNALFGQAVNRDGQSANFFQSKAVDFVPSPHDRFGAPMTPDVDAAQNEIADPTYGIDPIKEKNYAFTRECR